MRKNCLSNLQYLLLALLFMAMTGCGANAPVNATGAAHGPTSSIAAKLVWGARTAKKTASTVPANVVKLRLTVTGTAATGGAIPVARSEMATTPGTTAANGTVSGIYPGTVTLAVLALDNTGAVLYEGYALNVAVVAGAPTTIAAPIVMTVPLVKAQDENCVSCHETTLDASGQNLVADFKQSGHYTNSGPAVFDKYSSLANGKVIGTGCAGCHGPNHNDPNPAASGRCVSCHNNLGTTIHPDAAGVATACNSCHEPHNTKLSCVNCHAVGQDKTALGTFVHDNGGVRAILGAKSEFAKTSHHIFNGVGIAPTDAQCVACHLEGKVSGTAIAVDGIYHMADAKIHLRNAHTDADLAWDPTAATSADHTNMDNFCMSCHSATGADSSMSVRIQTYLNTNPAFIGAPAATATNPFGDLVSNSYDKQSRVRVVDVDDQFNTDNYSHHAVKGKKYSTRNSATLVAAWKSYSAAGGHSTDATVPGTPRFNASTQKTLYDGGLLGNNGSAGTGYTPLDTAKAGATIGDDSQLHCGDCHTVGQWKAGSSTNADGSATSAVIGAHGSNNEYMLRNTKGTDALNGLGTFICYNCHNDKAGGNTSGGYYAGAYWNNTTGKWVTAGNLHLSIHGGGSSVQYGGGSGCIEVSAGLAFTDFSSAIHNNNSWKSSWATPNTSTSLLLGSDANGIAWDENLTITQNQAAPSSAYATIKLQSVLNGSQTVFFDAGGKFTGIYSSLAAGNSTPVASYAAGNGNPSNKSTWDGTKNTVLDQDGTVIDPTVFAGTGRNHFVGGNIFGNGCLNCHNVGRTGFGGIHGGKNTYQTGFSTTLHGVTGQAAPVETQSTYRFMPGLGNYGYIPAGSGKEAGTYTTNPATGLATLVDAPTIAVTGKAGWEAWNGVGTSAAGGCYTNDYAKQNAGWSGCNHHGNGGVNDGGPGGTQPVGFGAGEPPTKTDTKGQVGRTLNY
jgi:hypothetical protein